MHLVIIGNGIAGITCARHVRKRRPDARITVVSDESEHFWSRTAAMYIYMGVLTYEQTKPYAARFWSDSRIDLVADRVEAVDTEAKTLRLRDGQPLAYDRLLIATGSVSTFYGWPGQDLGGVQGLYGLGDLAAMEAATMDGGEAIDHAVVVGGGLIGVELAEMLHVRGIGVTFLVREETYMDHILPPEEGRMAEQEIRHHSIDLRMQTELKGILSDAAGRCRAVVTSAGDEVPCRFVGLATGVQPNVAFLEESGIETDRGVLVDDHFRTSAEGVFAAGDCAQHRTPPEGRRPVEQLWYTGREHGAVVAANVCDDARPYRPDVFYNSAKFFDVEYQTYGRIDPTVPDGEESLYWEDADGKRALRLQYESGGERAVVGFNFMGVRYRHAVCAEWIRSRTGVEDVLQGLGVAQFDPEFAETCEAALVAAYNARHGTALEAKAARGWRRWMARLPMNGTTPHALSDSFAHLP